jgi:nucleotide sugar dehydrogenase
MGGINKKSVFIAKGVYSQFIKEDIKEVSSIECAEATKLFENVFRDVNIALVNEFALVCSKLGLDAYEVIEAASTKPFAFLPHYPGLVGGECIPVDTWYLIKQAEGIGVNTKLMRTAREINDYMAAYTVDMLRDALKGKNQKMEKSRIGILGLAYKKNVADSRVSLSKTIKEILEKQGAEVLMCDPVIEMFDPSNNVKLTPLDNFFKGLDGIVMATDHDIFNKINLEKARRMMRTRVIVDARNFFDAEKAKRLGFAYRGIGKPVD